MKKFCLVLAPLLWSYFLAFGPVAAAAAKGASPKKDALLSSAQTELQRAQDSLSKLDPGLYFLSYAIHDQDAAIFVATQGTLLMSVHTRRRTADVIVRVGTPALDNTHLGNRTSAINSAPLPLADEAEAIRRSFWRLTYEEYRKAATAYLNVRVFRVCRG
jgi:hypothetical protein